MNEIRQKIKVKLKTITPKDIYDMCFEADKRACDGYWPVYVYYNADLGTLGMTDTPPKYLSKEKFIIYKGDNWDAADVDWEDFVARAEAAGYGADYEAFRMTDEYEEYREEVLGCMDTDVNPTDLIHHLENLILVRILVGTYSPEWIEIEEEGKEIEEEGKENA